MCDREENVTVLMEKEKNYHAGLRIRREGDDTTDGGKKEDTRRRLNINV